MLSSFQELKLIARCVTFDDRDAFGLLVENYQDPLRRFLFNITDGDACLTDDISQETFLKAWINIRQFKGISKFKTWLFKIAYNEYIQEKRRRRDLVSDNIYQTNGATVSPHDITETQIDIKNVIQCLNENEKTVVILFYLEELPVKRIAQITGMPEGTIKVYLSRSRKKMQDYYKRDEK